MRYANVIYDRDRAAAVATIHDYLADIGIARCGRYGDWDHAWTDESFISGERAADGVLGRSLVAGLQRPAEQADEWRDVIDARRSDAGS